MLTANDGNIQYTRYCQVLCRPVDDVIGSPCLIITPEQLKEATTPRKACRWFRRGPLGFLIYSSAL